MLQTIIVKYFVKTGCGQFRGSFEEVLSEGTPQKS
jgi:hypothetical protein